MTRRAFSLIEVLMAVLILALGLLGLAAVFPVVITQQRNASDSAFSRGVAEAGVLAVTTHEYLARKHPDEEFGGSAYRSGWEMRRDEFPRELKIRDAWEPIGLINDAGTIRIESEVMDELGLPQTADLSAWSRLFPGVYVEEGEPTYVWDAVVRRVDIGPAQEDDSDELEAAVFVRRIDPGIRVPRGQSLSDVFTSGDTVPVGVDNDGKPTRNGDGDYSWPITMLVDFDPNDRTRLQMRGRLTLQRELRRPGQRFVDNFGNQYTVVAIDEDALNVVIIEPAIPEHLTSTRGGGPTFPGQQRQVLREIVFTPQTPAAIRVVRIKP